jgi:PAS domain S-box-containing protein
VTAGTGGARQVATRTVRSLVNPLRPWLPPLHQREFWAVQALVLVIAGGHALLEAIRPAIEPPPLYLLPTSLYFVPVVYAALNFGVRGSLATALWSAFLTVPNAILWHSGPERIGEIWQMAIVLAVAVFVGQRVDRETTARRDAEERERERRSSEARYRGLFDNAAEAVLILTPEGRIIEANAAAAELLGRSMDALREVLLGDIVSPAVARELVRGTPQQVVAVPGSGDRRTTWIEPIVCLPRTSADGGIETQLMLHDVTSQQERQRDLEAYARNILAAREEEQRRIGRELHDGPLQSLVLLWRKLDALGGREGSAGLPSVANDARELAESTSDELRRITRAMRPSVLDDLGLVAAIKSEATALARRTGVGVRVVHTGEEARLPTEIELTLLRVAQEALHNVERHADAGKVFVRLAFEPDQVRLVVRDDGQGLAAVPSASDLLEAGKLGLVGMQERVRLVGGRVTVRTRPGEGTMIEVSVPTRESGASSAPAE